MYVPEAFSQSDPGRLWDLIDAHPLATLVTCRDGQPQATPIPLILDRNRGRRGVLLGHMALANGQWKDLERGERPLAVFHGPHGYVSPAWYASPLNVPTWNYATVQARGGRTRLIREEAELESLLGAMVSRLEAREGTGWSYDLPGELRSGLLGAIIGFEIEIEEMVGKFKLSQNRSAEDRAGVRRALADKGDEASLALLALMAPRL